MPSKNPILPLTHIVENIARAREFIAGQDLESFSADAKTSYAAIRALEIISEASRRLSDDIRLRHPKIDWRRIAAAGSYYRHQYDFVDLRYIWNTITDHLEPLRTAAEQELERLR